ncbi:MAG: cytochrome c peroxidase [Bacteroidota bacterium]
MKIKITIISIVVLVSMLSFSVQEFTVNWPGYFPKPEYNFKRNPPDSFTIELGRNLFYSPVLSSNSTIACASCHSPYNAFSHTDHELSHGIHDQVGTRNAPALFNLAWQKKFMWDGAINHLDMQPLAALSHPKEMGESLPSVIIKLNESAFYRKLFYRAFNDSIITGERLLKALAQFQLTLISANSKYDQVKQDKAIFTEQEEKGYKLFLKNCNACHKEPMFTDYSFANNGLPVDTTLNDFGRGAITHKSEDSLLFKIPSLRNISYTYPYMHDGRFKKLQQVIDHYTDGIKPGKTLSDKLKKPIILSSNEKVDIIAFLLTLNDREFVFNPKHNYPGKN